MHSERVAAQKVSKPPRAAVRTSREDKWTGSRTAIPSRPANGGRGWSRFSPSRARSAGPQRREATRGVDRVQGRVAVTAGRDGQLVRGSCASRADDAPKNSRAARTQADRRMFRTVAGTGERSCSGPILGCKSLCRHGDFNGVSIHISGNAAQLLSRRVWQRRALGPVRVTAAPWRCRGRSLRAKAPRTADLASEGATWTGCRTTIPSRPRSGWTRWRA